MLTDIASCRLRELLPNLLGLLGAIEDPSIRRAGNTPRLGYTRRRLAVLDNYKVTRPLDKHRMLKPYMDLAFSMPDHCKTRRFESFVVGPLG